MPLLLWCSPSSSSVVLVFLVVVVVLVVVVGCVGGSMVGDGDGAVVFSCVAVTRSPYRDMFWPRFSSSSPSTKQLKRPSAPPGRPLIIGQLGKVTHSAIVVMCL
jgi:hypothetical protein